MIGPEGPIAHPYHSIRSEGQKFRPAEMRLRSAEMQAPENLFRQFRQHENLAGIDKVRITDLITIGLMDFRITEA